MNPHDPGKLTPLRGPLGLREVFFNRSDSAILGRYRLNKRKLIAVCAVCLISLGFVSWFYHESKWNDPADALGLQLLAWIAIEAGCLIDGYRMAWLASPAERRRRLAELALTELRPIEIAQWFIARRIWLYLPPLTILTLGVSLIQMCKYPDDAALLIPIILIGVNTWVTLYMLSWMQFAVFISAPSMLRAIWRQVMFYVVYGLITFWLVMIWFGISFLEPRGSVITEFDVFLLLPAVAAFWWIKYRFARSWAAHLERAILHRIEM